MEAERVGGGCLGEDFGTPYIRTDINSFQVGFSYSIPVNAYTDPSSGSIVTLPGAICPDYAKDWNCGTYSYGNQSLTANSTQAGAPNFVGYHLSSSKLLY